MALELLLFETENNPLNLCLIEELEAHLHPQAQLRTIKHLQNKLNENSQIILTTHSINLTSSIKLENLILCKNEKVYPLGREYTQLNGEDYEFLEMFLDATKANLFFAKGVIFVEGDAENILVPTIAEIVGRPLYEYGVSVVNIGGTAFKRYSRIFLRKSKEEKLNIPVAIITDLDVKDNSSLRGIALDTDKISEINKILNPNGKNIDEFKKYIFLTSDELKSEIKEFLGRRKLYDGLGKLIDSFPKEQISIDDYRNLSRERKEKIYNKDNIKTFINKHQTLEYDLAMGKLGIALYQAILLTKNQSLLKMEEIEELKKLPSDKKVKKIFIENFYENYEENKKSNLSKANVALNLSHILLKTDKGKTRKTLLEDEYCEYLIKAIEYVTAPIPKENL